MTRRPRSLRARIVPGLLTATVILSALANPGTAAGVGRLPGSGLGATPEGDVALVSSDATPPTVTAPTMRIHKGGSVTSNAVPIELDWTAVDPSRIARTSLQQRVDGGSWQPVTLSTAAARSARLQLWPPHEYQFRVRAVDGAGNRSAWIAGDPARVRLLSERASEMTTSGSWMTISSRDLLGGRAIRSSDAATTATLSFTGSQVAWLATRAPSRGTALVTLDGVPVATVDLHRAHRRARTVVFRHAWPTSGPHTLEIRVVGTAGHPAVDVDGFVVIDPPAGDPVLVGAGDATDCSSTNDSRTAALLDRIAGRVFVAGDIAYPDGTLAQLRNCYGPTWGRWRLRTSPVPGNHDYHTGSLAPYFAYFGSRAGTGGTGWYAYDLGTWRIYSLNANCDRIACGAGSAQVRWLEADLAANPRACVAAIWHQPLFSSGMHGNNPAVRPLWAALEAAGAEIVVNGHDHDYERFGPQTADGVGTVDGIREFVVGTGGSSLRPFQTVRANSVVRNAGTYGVLVLTLHANGYDWTFRPIAGQSFTDSGSAACH